MGAKKLEGICLPAFGYCQQLRMVCGLVHISEEYLPTASVSALRATVQGSETRISRLLFKLTVEISMMMHVLAAGLEIDDSQLDDLR